LPGKDSMVSSVLKKKKKRYATSKKYFMKKGDTGLAQGGEHTSVSSHCPRKRGGGRSVWETWRQSRGKTEQRGGMAYCERGGRLRAFETSRKKKLLRRGLLVEGRRDRKRKESIQGKGEGFTEKKKLGPAAALRRRRQMKNSRQVWRWGEGSYIREKDLAGKESARGNTTRESSTYKKGPESRRC